MNPPADDIVRVCCVADLHGNLPELPAHHVLLIGGDLCPANNHDIAYQRDFLTHKLLPWLKEEASNPVIVWGNHDFIGEKGMDLLPRALQDLVVRDEMIELRGLKIWGSPWQLRFFDWAFNLDEPELADKYARIPDGVDVIVSHGPPHGAGDFSRGKHLGSPSLAETIRRVKPKLVVTGHIHPAYGEYELHGAKVVNAALVDDAYRPSRKPVIVELPVAKPRS